MHEKIGLFYMISMIYINMYLTAEVSDQNTTKPLIHWVENPLKDTTNLKASEIYYKTQK